MARPAKGRATGQVMKKLSDISRPWLLRGRRLARLAVPMALLAAVAVLVWRGGMDRDLWWHLANGRDIAARYAPVTRDTQTFTVAGQPCLDRNWFFEIAAYAAMQAGGVTGLRVLHGLLAAGCLGVTAWAIRRRPRGMPWLLAVPVLLLLAPYAEPGPQWITWLMIPGFLRLARHAFAPHARNTWLDMILLWLAQMAWVNLGGEVLWGVAIAGLHGWEAWRAARRANADRHLLHWYAIAVLGVAVASLVSPLGLNLLTGSITGAFRAGLEEPPGWWLATAGPLTWLSWLALTGITGLSFWWTRRRLAWALLALYASVTLLSLVSERLVGSLAVLDLFIAMENMAAMAPLHLVRPATERGLRWAALVLLLGLGWGWFSGSYGTQPGPETAIGVQPADASRFLRAQGIRGRFLNERAAGGFLVWHNGPAILVAADGRPGLFPRRLVRALREIFSGPAAGLAEFEKEFAVDGAVVPWPARGLQRALARRRDWRLVFCGMHDAVWMRTAWLDAANKRRLAIDGLDLDHWFIPDQAAAYKEAADLAAEECMYRRALFFDAMGHPVLAARQAGRLRDTAPGSPWLVRLAEAGVHPD